jgi:hypothetical protein
MAFIAPSLVRALEEREGLEVERLHEPPRPASVLARHPGRHVGEALVIATRLAIVGLMLRSEVAAG